MRPRLRALTARNNLAAAYANAGNLSRAIAPREQTLDARERMLGADYLYQALIDAEPISVIGTGPYDLLRLSLRSGGTVFGTSGRRFTSRSVCGRSGRRFTSRSLGWSRQVHYAVISARVDRECARPRQQQRPQGADARPARSVPELPFDELRKLRDRTGARGVVQSMSRCSGALWVQLCRSEQPSSYSWRLPISHQVGPADITGALFIPCQATH